MASVHKDELDAEIAALSASGRDYEALLAATEQLAQVATQVLNARPLAHAAWRQPTSMCCKHTARPVLRCDKKAKKGKLCKAKGWISYLGCNGPISAQVDAASLTVPSQWSHQDTGV